MAKTNKMTNVIAKYDADKGRLVLSIPVKQAIEDGGLQLSSREKTYLVASTHGYKPIATMPGVSFSLNVAIKKDTYERIHMAKKLLDQSEQTESAQTQGLTAEELVVLRKLLAKLS